MTKQEREQAASNIYDIYLKVEKSLLAIEGKAGELARTVYASIGNSKKNFSIVDAADFHGYLENIQGARNVAEQVCYLRGCAKKEGDFKFIEDRLLELEATAKGNLEKIESLMSQFA